MDQQSLFSLKMEEECTESKLFLLATLLKTEFQSTKTTEALDKLNSMQLPISLTESLCTQLVLLVVLGVLKVA